MIQTTLASQMWEANVVLYLKWLCLRTCLTSLCGLWYQLVRVYINLLAQTEAVLKVIYCACACVMCECICVCTHDCAYQESDSNKEKKSNTILALYVMLVTVSLVLA